MNKEKEVNTEVEFVVTVPLYHVDATDLNEVSQDIKSSLERATWKITGVKTRMIKEKAIEFTKEYLRIKSDSYVKPTEAKRAWEIAVEYILEDIIPYIYGEALD